MPQKKIYESTKKHFGGDGGSNPFPHESDSGRESHSFNIPPRYKYHGFELLTLPPTYAAHALVIQKPKKGVTGRKKTIKVDWFYAPFGRIEYKLKVFATRGTAPAPPVKVVVFSHGWLERARNAIDQRQRVQLVLMGPLATELNAILRQSTPATYALAPMAAVAITTAIIFAIVSVAAFATIGIVLLYAVDHRYVAKVEYKGSANPLEGKLVFDLYPAT